MKPYISPAFDLLQFHVENVLAYSVETDDDFETPIIPFKLPQVKVGNN